MALSSATMTGLMLKLRLVSKINVGGVKWGDPLPVGRFLSCLGPEVSRDCAV